MYQTKVGLEYIIKRPHWCALLCTQTIHVRTSIPILTKLPVSFSRRAFDTVVAA